MLESRQGPVFETQKSKMVDETQKSKMADETQKSKMVDEIAFRHHVFFLSSICSGDNVLEEW